MTLVFHLLLLLFYSYCYNDVSLPAAAATTATPSLVSAARDQQHDPTQSTTATSMLDTFRTYTLTSASSSSSTSSTAALSSAQSLASSLNATATDIFIDATNQALYLCGVRQHQHTIPPMSPTTTSPSSSDDPTDNNNTTSFSSSQRTQTQLFIAKLSLLPSSSSSSSKTTASNTTPNLIWFATPLNTTQYPTSRPNALRVARDAVYVAGMAAGHAIVIALHAGDARPLWERPLALGIGEARTLAATVACGSRSSGGGARGHGVDVVVSGHLYHARRRAHQPFVARIDGSTGKVAVLNHHVATVGTSTMANRASKTTTSGSSTSTTKAMTTTTTAGRDVVGSSSGDAGAQPHGYWHLHWHHQHRDHEHETRRQRNNASGASTTTRAAAVVPAARHTRTILSVSHFTEVAASFFLLATQTVAVPYNQWQSLFANTSATANDDVVSSSVATDIALSVDDRPQTVTRRYHAFFACHRRTLECTKLHIPLTAMPSATGDGSRPTSPPLSLSDLITSHVTALVSPISGTLSSPSDSKRSTSSSSSSALQPPHAFVAAQSGLFFRIDFPSLSVAHLASSTSSTSSATDAAVDSHHTQQPQYRVVWTHHLNSSVLLASVDASTLVAVFGRGTHVAVYDAQSGAPVSQWLRRGATHHRRRHSRFVCLGVTTMLLPVSGVKKRDGSGVVHVAYVGGVVRRLGTAGGIGNGRSATSGGTRDSGGSSTMHVHLDSTMHEQQEQQEQENENTMIPILSMLQVTKRHPVVPKMASPDSLLSAADGANNGNVSNKNIEAAAVPDGKEDNNVGGSLQQSNDGSTNKLAGDGNASTKEASDNTGVVTMLALVFALLGVMGGVVCCRMLCVHRLNRGSSFDSDGSGNGFDGDRDMRLPVRYKRGKGGGGDGFAGGTTGGGQQQKEQGWFSKWFDNNNNNSSTNGKQHQVDHSRRNHQHYHHVQYHPASGGRASAGSNTASTGLHHHHHPCDDMEGNTSKAHLSRKSDHDGIDADIDDGSDDSDDSQCEVYRRSGKNPLSNTSLGRFTARTRAKAARAVRARVKAKSHASKSMMHVHAGGHHHKERGNGGGGGGRTKMFHPSMPVRALSDPGGRLGKY